MSDEKKSPRGKARDWNADRPDDWKEMTGEVSVSRPRESVRIEPRQQGKTLRMEAERLAGGGTKFTLKDFVARNAELKPDSFSYQDVPYTANLLDAIMDPKAKVVAVVKPVRHEMPTPAFTARERAAFERDAARFEERIRAQKEEFVTRSLMGAVTYTDVQALPAPTLEEIIASISEAMKAVGYRPPEFEPRYQPRMSVDPDWSGMDRLRLHAMSYPFYVCKFPTALMNIGDLGEPYVDRWAWTPPDPATRALRLIAARPLDRRRIKRCLRIMGLSR